MKGLLTLLLCALLCLTGCARQDSPAIRLVTRITIRHQDQSLDIEDSVQMSQILNALRSTGRPFLPEEDPEVMELPVYDITLTHSDGETIQWQIKGSRYLRKLPGPWQEGDSKQIAALTALLQTL